MSPLDELPEDAVSKSGATACYESMTDAEFYQECADVVQYIAGQLSTIVRQTAAIFRVNPNDYAASAALRISMSAMMESLGNLMDALDAVSDDDEWTAPIYDELHRRLQTP